MSKSILIADDHEAFRHGLASLLRELGGFDVVAEAADGAEAVGRAGSLQPDIALLDLEMPRLTGIEAAPQILKASPRSRIVVLSMYADAHYQERARKAGASGYALKSEPITALLEILDLVLRGAAFVSNTLPRSDSAVALRSAKLDLDELSPREREVLRLLAEGRRTTEVAALLGVSVKSVETYRSRLMDKLGIDSIAALVRFAIRTGVIAP